MNALTSPAPAEYHPREPRVNLSLFLRRNLARGWKFVLQTVGEDNIQLSQTLSRRDRADCEASEGL